MFDPDTRTTRRLRVAQWLAVAAAMIASLAGGEKAAAGPPYLSDDPEPTDVGHWEIYNYVIGTGGATGLAGEAGFDINYGPARDLQLTAVLPLAFDNPRGFGVGGLSGGPGDVELAVKYRFLHQADNGWAPDVAVFPRLFVPTADRRLGTGQVGLLLPVWAEKDRGPWSVFGGGGYQINPGAGQLGYWQGGLAISRELGQRLSLGAEVYGQTRSAEGGGGVPYEAVDLAATWKLVNHWSLLASAGPTWSPGGADGYVFYLAFKADY